SGPAGTLHPARLRVRSGTFHAGAARLVRALLLLDLVGRGYVWACHPRRARVEVEGLSSICRTGLSASRARAADADRSGARVNCTIARNRYNRNSLVSWMVPRIGLWRGRVGTSRAATPSRSIR